MKHLTVPLWSFKPRFDELRKINEENLKFLPLLDAKIKELCEKREKSKTVLIIKNYFLFKKIKINFIWIIYLIR